MTTRRSFLGAMAGGLGAAVACRQAEEVGEKAVADASPFQKLPLGLQLWSVRDQMEEDLSGTLAQIKAWGIDEVESAGFHGRSAAEFAAELQKAGLSCQAMHIGWDELDQSLDGALEDAEALGATTLLNPYLPHESTPSASRDEILRAGAAFAEWGERCRAAGKRFGYHVHGQEFGPAPEGTLFDVLAQEAGPDVGFELDVFWAVAGGADPLALMKKYAGRVWYTHLKDMAKDMSKDSSFEDLGAEDAKVVLGTGRIDIDAIVKAGPAAGVEIHYIEDESSDPVGNIPKSIAYYEGLKA
jgi:sugar phosphate isomerase/epimerase